MRIFSVLKPMDYLKKQNEKAHDIQQLCRPPARVDTLMLCIFPSTAPPLVIPIPLIAYSSSLLALSPPSLLWFYRGWESWDLVFFFFFNGCRLLSKQGLYAPFLHLSKIYAACILFILQKLEGDPPVSAIDINQICKNVLTVKNGVRDSSHFFYPFLSRPKLIFKGILSNPLNWGSNQTPFGSALFSRYLKINLELQRRSGDSSVPPQQHLQWQIRVEVHNCSKLQARSTFCSERYRERGLKTVHAKCVKRYH